MYKNATDLLAFLFFLYTRKILSTCGVDQVL